MKNQINWFEIPALDFDRAVKFYEEILQIKIQQQNLGGSKMGFFPSDENSVSGAIVTGDGYEPSEKGPLIYLNGGNDLSIALNLVEKSKGKIIVPKTQISQEFGYFAIFRDAEGNRVALHSYN